MKKGAFYSGNYPNYFAQIGIGEEEISRRIDEIYQTLFYGSREERLYHPVEPNLGYLIDTGNLDVRTEGMSYGMMISVQLNRKEEFDRIWNWVYTNMYLTEGCHKGFFCWSNAPDGSKNASGPASDGEEFFAMALLFASHRWGDGEGVFHYSRHALDLLHAMIRSEAEGEHGRGMFDLSNHLIRFIVEVDFSDPSYHLPHFYELFGEWANPQDRGFYKEAAKCSRAYLHKACHPITGLNAEYADYDGIPVPQNEYMEERHDWYYSDAYRTIMNIALDHIWFDADDWQREAGKKLLSFYCDRLGEDNWDTVPLPDGTLTEEKARHPVAVIAANATAGILSGDENGRACIRKFYETPLRTGERRYYDNLLYLFAFLMLGGRYRIY